MLSQSPRAQELLNTLWVRGEEHQYISTNTHGAFLFQIDVILWLPRHFLPAQPLKL